MFLPMPLWQIRKCPSQRKLATSRLATKGYLSKISDPSRLPYEWEFEAFLAALSRSGLFRAGHEVGQASMVSDNFMIEALITISPLQQVVQGTIWGCIWLD